MSQGWSDHHREWSLYCSYDSSHPQIGHHTPQQEDLRNSATSTTAGQHDEMSSRSASSSSTDSLYALPSPQNLRQAAQLPTAERYTSLQDIPPFSLDNSNGASIPSSRSHEKYGKPTSPKTPPSSLPPVGYTCHQRPPGLTNPLPEPLPRGSLRVVNRDPPALDDSSSTSTNGNMKFRFKTKSERGTVSFTDPFAENKGEQKAGLAKIQAALNEKRKVATDLHIATTKLETAFKGADSLNSAEMAPKTKKAWCSKHYANDTCVAKAEKREESKYLSSQPPSLNKQSAHTRPLIAESPPYCFSVSSRAPNGNEEKETTDMGPPCFVDPVEREHFRRVHAYQNERLHQEWLRKLAEKKEQEKQCSRAHEEKMRRKTATTWPWADETAPKDSFHDKSPVTLFIEDVAAWRAGISESTSRKTEPKTSNSERGSLSTRSATIAVKDEQGTIREREIPALHTTQAAEQERERQWCQLQGASKTAVATAHADPGAQWDDIDLSDDEEWERVAGDEGAEWEVVEK